MKKIFIVIAIIMISSVYSSSAVKTCKYCQDARSDCLKICLPMFPSKGCDDCMRECKADFRSCTQNLREVCE
jgi:hypothetical protein